MTKIIEVTFRGGTTVELEVGDDWEFAGTKLQANQSDDVARRVRFIDSSEVCCIIERDQPPDRFPSRNSTVTY
jgi:hypothetical protein